MPRMSGRPRAPARRRPTRGPRRVRAPRRVRSLAFSQPEQASLTEVLRGQVLTTNTMYGASLVQLAQYQRASLVASAYQEYRITGVKFTFTPRFDTFSATTDIAQALSVPYLYHIVDKVGAIKAGASLAQLQSMGAKPKRFDDKNIVVKYKPAVMNQVEGSDAAPGLVNLSRPVTSPWLLTNTDADGGLYNPSVVSHRGLWFYLDAKGLPGDGTYEYDVDIEVNFQFKKALFPRANGIDTIQGGNVLPMS